MAKARWKAVPAEIHTTASYRRLPRPARELLLLLWLSTDSAGRILADPLEVQIKTHTDLTLSKVKSILDILESHSYLTRYSVGTHSYFYLTEWDKVIPNRVRIHFGKPIYPGPSDDPKRTLTDSKDDVKRQNDVGCSVQQEPTVEPSVELEKKQTKKEKYLFEDRQRVFYTWLKVFSKKWGKFKPGDKRDQKIIARMNSGYTADNLVMCIEGFAKNPWRHEELSRHRLTTLLRDDEQIDTGIAEYHDGGKHGRNTRNASGNNGKAWGRANATIGYSDQDRSRISGDENSGQDALSDDVRGRDQLPRRVASDDRDLSF